MMLGTSSAPLLLFVCLLGLDVSSGSSSWAEVSALPGVPVLSSRHYTGFIEVDAETGTHLFFYLTTSQHSSTDPLVWWFNGGPGASSLAGLFSENGPYILNDQSKLIPNPHAWNLHADVLYVEFAAGIGFSYCSNSTRTDPSLGCVQASESCSPCFSSDSTVTAHNVRFIEQFVEMFPQFKSRPLVLAGESYAGVYGPLLAQGILEHFSDTSKVNLTALWVTDPCTDNSKQYGWLDLGPDFVYEAGMIDRLTYDALTSDECTASRTPVGDRVRALDTSRCRRAWRLYDVATAGAGDAIHPEPIPGVPMYIDPLDSVGPSTGADLPGFVGSLRQLIHANSSKNAVYHLEIGNNGYDGYTPEYSACNNHPRTKSSMIDVYKSLNHYAASKPSAAHFRRVTISSGDQDPVVGLHGTEAAVMSLGFPESESGRLPWFYNCTATDASTILHKPASWGRDLQPNSIGVQLAGWHTALQTGTDMQLEFLTFRNSGHMVPAYAPQRSLHVLKKIVAREPLTPSLPHGWGDAPDDQFYARSLQQQSPGIYAQWVAKAMSAEFAN